jgi:putative transposase
MKRFASWSAVASAKARHRFERSQVAFAHLCNNHSPMSAGEKVSWPYAPTHRLLEGGAYFVTAVTYEKQHRFRGKERLSWLHDNLLQCCLNHGWRLQARAVFSNHYHFVAHCEDRESASKLPGMLGLLHEQTTKQVSHEDGVEERRVWYNYSDRPVQVKDDFDPSMDW